MRAVLAVALLVACGGDEEIQRPVFAPFIDVPPADSDAYPYSGVDELVLEVADEGRDTGRSETFAIDEPLELTDLDYAEDQVVHLTGRTRGVEVSYGRTCAVDIAADSVEQTPHLYFSRMVKWGAGVDPGGIAQASVLGYSAPDGSAVYVGDARVSRFDPLSGTFSEVPIDSIAARADGTLAALPDGRAVLVGGTAGDNGVPLVEAIDPNAEPVAASRLESQPGPRLKEHAAVTLEDGKVLVAGGELQDEGTGDFAVTGSAWVVGFSTANTLDEPEELVNQMVTPRRGHTMTRLGDEPGAAVVILGGLDGAGMPVGAAELYRPPMRTFQSSATMLLARWNHRAVRMADGSILIIGGFAGDSDNPAPASAIEVYDPVTGTFNEGRGVLGPDDAVTDMAVVRMPDGRVLLIGGRNAQGEAVATVLIARYDPLDGRVDLSVSDPLERPRAGHSAAILCDGTILVVGGGPGSERYNPPSAGRR